MLNFVSPLIRGLSASVHVGLNHSYMEAKINGLQQRILTITVLVSLLGIGLATFISKRFTKPLTKLAQLMEDFGRGEYVELNNADLTSGGKEIQQLGHSYNEMLEERHKADANLRHAGIVFDEAIEGIFITDGKGRIIRVNRAFSDITGYDEDEALGNTPKLLQSEHHDIHFYVNFWYELLKEDRWQGEFWNRHKSGEIYVCWENITTIRNEHGDIINYICIFSDITEKKNSEEHVRHLAHHDALTDLPNRVLFNERVTHGLARAHREANKVAVMFLDLDRFKQINDSLGHPVGDDLLKALARRLASIVREDDTVARIGGDEFTILLEGVDNVQDVATVAAKIIESFNHPYTLSGHELIMTASVGISLYPDDGNDVDTLLQNADAAMYRAKEKGRNNYQFYTTELSDSALYQLTLETQLRRALERNELELYYQPQLSLDNDQLVGAETLLRWHNPDKGMISPAIFIPLLEETGLILPIGEWVLRTACQQAMSWMEEGIIFGVVSVNISGIQLERGDLLETVTAVLKETGLAPEKLELEITESAIMHDTECVIETLEMLQKMGVKLAIDDFGTGYSSLSYLKRLPLHKLKIDQTFVADITVDDNDEAIVRTILALASSLQLDVIAEGVETEEQQAKLLAMGCREVQGYLHSKPLPADEFLVWVKKFNSTEADS